MDKQLVEVIENSGIEKSQAQMILDSFSGFFEKAKGWEEKAKAIIVTDVSQTKEMQEAREIRLELKNIRVDAEKVRKEKKEFFLRGGKAIDGIGNVIKALIVPIEEHLEKQEKFAEVIEEQKKEKINSERIVKLQQYVEDVEMYNLKVMSDEAFIKLLETSKIAFEAQKEAVKKAEEELVTKEKEEKKEQERIRIENEKLKIEAEAREKEIEKERIKAETERKKIEEQRKVEAEAREKLETELQAKKDEEEKAKRELEEKERLEKEAKEETERQSKLAPEKDKIFAYSESIKNIEAPEGLSKAGQEIIKNVEQKLLAISQEIKEEIKNL